MKTLFRTYAWAVLIFHLGVVLWGSFVRASGSGAGCGEHWPLCNGQIVPRAPLNATVIEFSHRLTSGIALVSVWVLVIWAYRVFPKGHGVRRGALLAVVCTIIECAIPIGSPLRDRVASHYQQRPRFHYPQPKRWRQVFGLSIARFVVAAILGGFAALGDTLVVSTSLTESGARS